MPPSLLKAISKPGWMISPFEKWESYSKRTGFIVKAVSQSPNVEGSDGVSPRAVRFWRN